VVTSKSGQAYTFQLLFSPDQIRGLAGRYSYPNEEEVVADGVRAGRRGYFTCKEFLAVCAWKTPRTKQLVKRNKDETVRSTTELALSTSLEHVKLPVLSSLHGVGWPTASALLHLATDRYPIIDFRALWSVGFERTVPLNYDFWEQYVEFCRRLADQSGVSMRELDRALWWYSREQDNAGKGAAAGQ
jgi:hypothetical protein